MGRALANVGNDRAQLSKSKSSCTSVHGQKLQECSASVQAQLAVSKRNSLFGSK